MEVHHHPDLHHKKKNFKEYFLEFLMIFLAVTMGFFAESYREHLKDQRQEKEFIVSLKEDLISDTIQLNVMLSAGKLQYEKLDSLYILLKLAREQKPFNMNRLYYLNFKYSFGLIFFRPNKRTISQIKSTGTFSLITNKACRDSITVYENFNDDAIQLNDEGYKVLLTDLNKMSQKIFNYDQIKVFGFMGAADVYLNDSLKLKLVNDDKLLLSEYGNKDRSLMMMLDILIRTEQMQLNRSKNLIALLNKEYNLKN